MGEFCIKLLAMLSNAMTGTLILLSTFQLGLETVSGILCLLLGEGFQVPLYLRYGLGLAAVGLSVHGVSQAVRVPPVKEVEILLPGLASEFDGYRLIQLTDLHLSRLFPKRWAQQMVARANAQNPDLMVITGDLMDGTLEAREQDVAPLAQLNAPDGVLVITGNHEYYYGYESWMQRYVDLGMTRLCNSHVCLKRDGASLVVAGITDSTSRRFDLPCPNLKEALQGAPPNAPVILLDHKPASAPKASEHGVALQLSGHTHGGMIKGLHRIVARFNNGFVSELYRIGEMQLYVNNGTAMWKGFALRIGVPSELTVITLRRGTSS